MLKLMIVDDELLMRIGIRSMIDWETYGFKIAAESINGKEALEIAHKLQPDLIITDIKMPIMDGLQLIREASKTLTNCKYVIVSNFDEFGYVKEALKLGAVDYLIKSEITPELLIELLINIREKSEVNHLTGPYTSMLKEDITQSLSHLKESFFKDLISGLLDEREAAAKVKQLQIAVRSEALVIVKLRIDRFAVVRKKYVEKDERLLRFSIINILEEIMPRKRNKEVVIESSSEYLLIFNTSEDTTLNIQSEIKKLCSNIQRTMKDFMNISITIGVSSSVSSFSSIKTAYQEADQALRYSFFIGNGHVIFFDNDIREASKLSMQLNTKYADMSNDNSEANQANEPVLWHALERNNEEMLISVFDTIRVELAEKRATERWIREAYIRLTENISTHILARLQRSVELPYESLFTAETWDDVHDIVLDYAKHCFDADRKSIEQRSYTELAVDMIDQYYSENISLQSVANQINVNSSYLSRLFKQEKGENFISYLTRVRIDRAKLFLESRNYKIYEVADKVGYHNYTYFSKIFKKIVGVSPEEYKG